jgi:hypothetical protein
MVIKKRKIKKFKGGGMDASKADFGAPSGRKDSYAGGKTSTSADYGYGPGVTKNPNPGQSGNLGNKSTNVATTNNSGSSFTVNPVTTGMNIVGSLAVKVPGLGYAFEAAKNVAKTVQKKTRTQTARGETLFGNVKPGNKGMPITRDYYRATGKPLDVTSKEGTAYMKEAGFLKGPKTNLPGGGNESNVQLCPDGTYPPCKTPTTQIKSPVKKPNTFLQNFQSYDDGGEVVISSNVDKSLL